MDQLTMYFRVLFFVALALGHGVRAMAQQPMFRSLTVNDGLSVSHVSAIAQDSTGFIWFGTVGGGLNRYDGYNFRVFRHRPNDPQSLSSNAVGALHVDGTGTLWVGTDRGLDRFDPGTETFTHFEHDPEDEQSLGPGSVASIVKGVDGRLWVATNHHVAGLGIVGTVTAIDSNTGLGRRFTVSQEPGSNITCIFVDESGGVWAGLGHVQARRESPASGLYRFQSAEGRFTRVPLTSHGNELGVMRIAEGAPGRLWIGTWGDGLALMTRETEVATWYSFDPSNPESLAADYIVDLLSDDRGRAWAITLQGARGTIEGELTGHLNLIDPDTGEVTRFGPDPGNPHALGEFYLRSMSLDRFGTIWVGTSGSGIRYVDIAAPGLTLWNHNPRDTNSLSDNFVRSVAADSRNLLWVGTALGLDLINQRTGEVRHWAHDPDQPDSLGLGSVEALHVDRQGRLWVGTVAGLHLHDEVSNSFRHFRHDPSNPASLSDDYVLVIRETRDGRLLIGTNGGGLDLFDPETGGSSPYSPPSWMSEGRPNRVSAIEQSEDGTWWIEADGGLTRLDLGAETAEHFTHDPDNVNSISSDSVSSIFPDRTRDGVLWVGTQDAGLNRFDTSTGRWQRYDLEDLGVADNRIYAIQGDPGGGLWMSTNHGLVRFDPETLEIKIYGIDRGAQAPEYNHRAAARGPGGELIFGGVNGINTFFPDQIIDNTIPPRVVITKVEILQRETQSSDSPQKEILPTGTASDDTTLTHRERDLIFEYVGLHSTNPDKHIYQIKLEGVDGDWRDVGNLRRAAYSNLDAGSYRFRVRAANAHGVWNTTDASFDFSIRPPIWETLLFRGFVAFSVLLATIAVFRWRVSSLRKREQLLEKRVETRTTELQDAVFTIEAQAQRLEELDKAKSKFFANVSHEFRTPLTLTLGPLQDLKDGLHGRLPDEATDNLDIAIRNSRRLLRLVNQLLDTAKLEAGQLHPRFQEIDLKKLLDDIVISFSPQTERQKILLKSNFGDNMVPLWADVEMIEQVFVNLLSNAVKFTPEGGSIQLRLREIPSRSRVVVEVQDSGAGIPSDLVPHIFDRFFQASESNQSDQVGTGIGLALAKELVSLHHGEIDARSVQGLGTTLSVSLRTGRDHLEVEHIRSEPAEPPTPTTMLDAVIGEYLGKGDSATPPADESEDQPEVDATTVLVIDDSSEIRQFVRKHLETVYRVVEAEDGVDGLNRVRSELPDVVISDIIMPRMDGVELCQAIKSDPELDFIPVVLLTAKASMDNRVEGLESGADDYLTKPFEVRELRARVANLIASRRRLKERFGAPASRTENLRDSHPETVRESAFAERVRAIIEERMADEEFGVEPLAGQLNMSRVHLYRRVRDELGRQPSELIMEARLERAAGLLTNDEGSVAEIAYGVGFKSVSHFTKRFRHRYRLTPSAFRSEHNPPA